MGVFPLSSTARVRYSGLTRGKGRKRRGPNGGVRKS